MSAYRAIPTMMAVKLPVALWISAGAMLAATGAISVGGVAPARAELTVLEQQGRQVTSKLRTLAAASNSRAASDLSVQLAPFGRLASVVDDLQLLSTQNGLALSDASFNPQSDMLNKDIGRMEIGARLKGSYPALKKTIAGLLASHASLALDALSVRRARATDTVLEIELHLTLYYRKPA